MKPCFALFLLVVALPALVAAQQAPALDAEGIRARLEAAGMEPPAGPVKRSELAPGFYEVDYGEDSLYVYYVHESGGYFFVGDLFQLQGGAPVNASQLARRQARLDFLAGLDEADMLVYAPPAERVKTTVTVFTDIDCGYCRLLHQEMPELNRLGIAVRYLAYPRAGLGSESYDKLVSAWCAEDPLEAMNQAKAGFDIPPARCESPVAQQYELVKRMGINGTPAVIYESGELQAGYLPAEEMARRLGLAD